MVIEEGNKDNVKWDRDDNDYHILWLIAKKNYDDKFGHIQHTNMFYKNIGFFFLMVYKNIG
jgi:hypothetical protein